MNLNQSGKRNPNYKHGKCTIKHFCLDCGKEINYRNFRCLICSNKNVLRIRLFGKHHPNWQGGIARLPYPYNFSESLKEYIRNRDNRECQLCHITEKIHLKLFNRKLIVHHIDYNKKNCKKENLISLCNSCNIKVNTNRDYYYAYFTYVINNYILVSEIYNYLE